MSALFGLLSILIFFVCIIGLIYSTIKKKPKKKWTIGIVLSIIILCVSIATTDEKKETNSTSTPPAVTEQTEQPKELTQEEQQKIILDWYKKFHAVSTEFDNGFAPFLDTIQQIQNGTISPEDAANNFDLVYSNMDNVVHKLNDIETPQNLNDEQKQAIDNAVMSLQQAAQERRGACMTLRDGINSGNLNKTKIEIATKKLNASKDLVIKASTNLIEVFSKSGIDFKKFNIVIKNCIIYVI